MAKEYESDAIVVLRQEHKIMAKQIQTYQSVIGSFRIASKRSKQKRQLQNARGNIHQMHLHIISQKQRIHDLEELLLQVDASKLGWHASWIKSRLEKRQKRIQERNARKSA